EPLAGVQRRLARELAAQGVSTTLWAGPATASPTPSQITRDDRFHHQTPPLHARRDADRVDRDLLLAPRRAGRPGERDPQPDRDGAGPRGPAGAPGPRPPGLAAVLRLPGPRRPR